MSTKTAAQPKIVPIAAKPENVFELLQQYGGNVIQFSGTEDALYERHPIFDSMATPGYADA